MLDKAYKEFISALDSIKSGTYFDEDVNNKFDYMLKSLWNTEYKTKVKTDLLNSVIKILENIKNLETPAPFVYILISLKDKDITNQIEAFNIADFVKSNASEESAFNLINLIEMMSEKNVSIKELVQSLTKTFNNQMNSEMILALSSMICIRFPEFTKLFLGKFVEMGNNEILKDFVKSNGKTAFVGLIDFMTPGQINSLFK